MIKIKRISLIKILLSILMIVFLIYLPSNKHILKLFHPLKYQEQVNQYSKEFNLDPLLVFAIIKVESSFDKYALSDKGAKGLMQLTEKTAVWASEKLNISNFIVENLYDPNINIRMGCWYLSNLRKEFDGNMELVIIAYNAGSGRVEEWLKDKRFTQDGKKLQRIPYIETDRYIKKVIKEYSTLKYIYE